MRDVGLLDGDDLADRAVVDPLHRLADAQVVAPAEPGDEAEVLLLGLFGGGHRHLHRRHVDAVRLFAEDVLAGVDGRLQVDGVEVRRGGDQHHVDAALDQLLVGVEADEAMIVVDGHLLGIHLLQPLRGCPGGGRRRCRPWRPAARPCRRSWRWRPLRCRGRRSRSGRS